MEPLEHEAGLPPRPQEQLLIDLLDELPAGRLLTNTAGRAQFAAAYAERHPNQAVRCWSLDLYQHQLVEQYQSGGPANLRLECGADLPDEMHDVVALMVSKQGNGELTRELLQQAHERLAPGGRLVATSDNAKDHWLREQIEKLFGKVSHRDGTESIAYLATKSKPLKKRKDYACEFDYKDGEHLLRLRTRPGVFSHREVDDGARALMKTMEIYEDDQILDIGCGCGILGLAAATRQPTARVSAIDASPRAVESTRWAAEANGRDNLTAELDCDGRTVPDNTFDLALANPPYFSSFRIAETFVGIAARGLKSEGWLLIVTKTPRWYQEHLPQMGFEDVGVEPAKNYVIVGAQRIK